MSKEGGGVSLSVLTNVYSHCAVIVHQALAEVLLFEATFSAYRFLPDPRMVRSGAAIGLARRGEGGWLQLPTWLGNSTLLQRCPNRNQTPHALFSR